MKRKVKKFAEGGTNVRTRTDEEFAEDSKFGGYGRYMPKGKEYTLDEAKEKISGLFGGRSKAKEEAALDEKRPIAKSSFGYEDMDGRMPAESTWSGDQSPKAKAKAAPEPEPEVKGPFSRGANPDFESTREVIRGESAVADKDSGGGSKASGTKVKKAKLPSNPNNDSSSYAPPRSQSFASPKKEPPLRKVGEAIMGTVANASKPYSSSMYDKMKGRKAGGSIKMASGGKVSSASSRADGIAQRGKTRGKIC